MNNTNNEEDIIEYLDKYRKAATEVLEKEYSSLADKDIDYARTEAAIYNFKTKKVKKLIQI